MTRRERKKLDFYAWHPFDYRADTTHLTREENFAYRAILDEIFITSQDDCRIPGDDEYLRRVVKATVEEWPVIRHTLIDGPRPMLKRRGKWVTSPRLTGEIKKAQKIVAAQSGGGSRGRSKQLQGDPEVTPQTPRQIESKKKPLRVSKREKGLSNDNPAAGAIRSALREAGIGMTKASEKLVERWAETPGPERVVELLKANLDRVQAARAPLSYFRKIVSENGIAEAPAPAAEPEPERTFAEIVAEAAPSVYEWIENNGDPDKDEEARTKFDLSFRRIAHDRDGEDRWSKWLRVCKETGVDPKPSHASN